MSKKANISAVPPLRICARIMFGSNATPDAALATPGFGLGEAEPGLRWTLGPQSGFAMTLGDAAQAPDSNMWLELQASPFLAPPKIMAQPLRVWVNGVEAGHAMVHGPASLTFTVPEAAQMGERLDIILQHEAAASPHGLGLGPDTRPLGLALHQAILLRGDARHYGERAYAPRERPGFDGAQEAAVRALTALSARELMGCFESLGITEEFALVQRMAGVEADGLLAAGNVAPAQLLAGLDCGFAGIGDGAGLVFYDAADRAGASRPMVLQSRLGLAWRLPDALRGMEEASRAAAMGERLTAARRRLLGHLARGDRIFVYHQAGPLDEAEMRSLRLLLRSYGQNALLVLTAGPRLRDGAVQALAHGLYHGSVDYLTRPDRTPDQINMPVWLSICANAYRLWREDGFGGG